MLTQSDAFDAYTRQHSSASLLRTTFNSAHRWIGYVRVYQRYSQPISSCANIAVFNDQKMRIGILRRVQTDTIARKYLRKTLFVCYHFNLLLGVIRLKIRNTTARKYFRKTPPFCILSFHQFLYFIISSQRKFRFRLHICKVSILVLPLATVRTLPHPPPCNSCPARPRRHRMNSSVYPRFEILLLPLPREHVCCFRTQIHHYGCSLVSSVCFFVPQANR